MNLSIILLYLYMYICMTRVQPLSLFISLRYRQSKNAKRSTSCYVGFFFFNTKSFFVSMPFLSSKFSSVEFSLRIRMFSMIKKIAILNFIHTVQPRKNSYPRSLSNLCISRIYSKNQATRHTYILFLCFITCVYRTMIVKLAAELGERSA